MILKGYEKASEIVKVARAKQVSVREVLLDSGVMNEQTLNELISPEVVSKLGF